MNQPHVDGLARQPDSFDWTQAGVGLGPGGATHTGS